MVAIIFFCFIILLVVFVRESIRCFSFGGNYE